MAILHAPETLVLLALLAEVKVRADGAFEADAADTRFTAVAGDAVAVDVAVDEVVAGVEFAVNGERDVVVDGCKGMIGVDFRLGFDADAAEVVVLAFQAFMADTDNVLHKNVSIRDLIWGRHLLAFVAGSTVFQAPAGTKTIKDCLVARRVGQMIGILEGESVCGMMMILFAHKATNTQGEVLTTIAHNICRDIRFH